MQRKKDNMKILIVDDNIKVRELTKTLLAGSDYEFYECEDGDETLSACEKYKPDIILMDIKMKRMDGITATKEIKKVFPKVIVIMFTNYPFEELIEQSIKVGAERIIDKEELFQLPQFLKKYTNK